jgi:hypothetical protein
MKDCRTFLKLQEAVGFKQAKAKKLGKYIRFGHITNLALFLTTVPFLFLNIHLVPITLRHSLGFSTKTHTLLRLKLLSSSCIASNQSGSSSASNTFFEGVKAVGENPTAIL